jgi:transcriptional regulator with XRE-family HTH domain
MLGSRHLPDYAILAITDKAFYVQLGERIAAARKAQGITQSQVAEALGIAQQTLAHYEGGKLRVAVAPLAPLALTLWVSVEELVGVPTRRAGKRRPTPKLQQQIERLSDLPQAKQRGVMEMLEDVLMQTSR